MMKTSQITSGERKFFVVIKYFIIVVMVVSLLAAIGGGVIGFIKYNKKADTTIKPPQINYDNLIQEYRQKKLQPPSSSSPSGPQVFVRENPDNIPAEYLPALTSIEIALKGFATETQQDQPGNNTRAKIYKRAATFKEYFPIADTLKLLNDEAQKLLTDAPRVKSLPASDIEAVTWGEFLTFFFKSVDTNLEMQRRNIAEEQARIDRENRQGQILLNSAASSVGLFLIFTILLALFNIESHSYNTYALLLSNKSLHTPNEKVVSDEN